MKVRAHTFVDGTVQGVFFRSKTEIEARRRKVCGWVRNTRDGRVEAVFEGERQDVEKMIDFCRRGPPAANVMNVDVQWENYTGKFKDFKIRYGW